MVGSISSQIIRLAVLIDSHDPNAAAKALPPPQHSPLRFFTLTSNPKKPLVIYGKKLMTFDDISKNSNINFFWPIFQHCVCVQEISFFLVEKDSEKFPN